MMNVSGFVSKLFPSMVPNSPYAVGPEEPFGIENRVFPEDPAAFLTPPVRDTEHDDSDSDSSSQITLSSDEDESNYKMMDSLVYPEMSADFDAEESKEEHIDSPHPNITVFRGNRPSNSEDDADDEFLMNVGEEEDEDDAPHPNFTLFRGSRAYEMNDSDDDVFFGDREDNSDSDEEDEDVHASIRPFEHWSIHELGDEGAQVVNRSIHGLGDLSARAHAVAGTSGAQAVNYARVSFSDEEQDANTPTNTPVSTLSSANHVNVIPYESSDYEPEYNYDGEEETQIDYQVFHPTPCMICEQHVVYQNVYENSCCENIFCRDCLMGYARTHGSHIVCPKCRVSIDSVKRY